MGEGAEGHFVHLSCCSDTHDLPLSHPLLLLMSVCVVCTCGVNMMWNQAHVWWFDDLMTAQVYCWITQDTYILRQLPLWHPVIRSINVLQCWYNHCASSLVLSFWNLCWIAVLFTETTSLLNTIMFMVQTWPPSLVLVLPLYCHDPPPWFCC